MAVAEELKIVVKAEVDKAIAGLKKVQGETGKTGKSAQSLGKTMLKTGLAFAAAAISIRALQKAFTNAFRAFAQQEQAVARLDAVIKATGAAAGFTVGQMKDMADEMQRVTVFGDELVLSAQAVLSTFRNISGQVFPDTLKVAADMATVMGTDLQSAVVQLGKALNDPATGLTFLNRSGVTFSQTQKDMIKQLIEANDLLGAQSIILREVEAQFGGAAEAIAKTATGAFKQLNNELGDLQEIAGRSIATIFDDFARKITTFVSENKDKLEQLVINFPEVATLVFNRVITIMQNLFNFGNMVKIFSALGEALINIFVGVFKAAWKIQLNWLKLIAEPWIQFGGLVVDIFRNVFARMVNLGIDALNFLANDPIKKMGDFMATMFKAAMSKLQEFGRVAIEKLAEKFRALSKFLGDVFKAALTGFIDFDFKGAFADFKAGVTDRIEDASDAIVDLGNNWGNFQHIAVREITPLGERWEAMTSTMTEASKNFLMGYVDMAKALAVETGTFLKTALQVIDDPLFRAKLEALLTKIESVGGVVTPSVTGGGAVQIEGARTAAQEIKELAGAYTELESVMTGAEDIMNEGIAVALENMAEDAAKAVTVFQQFIPAFEGIGAAMVEGTKGLGNAMKQTVVGIIRMYANLATAQAGILLASPVPGSRVQAQRMFVAAAAAHAVAGAINAIALADGGIVTGPTNALIGEAGPEAVIPLSKMGGMGDTIIIMGDLLTQEEAYGRVTEFQQRRARPF